MCTFLTFTPLNDECTEIFTLANEQATEGEQRSSQAVPNVHTLEETPDKER
ncbi:MAG: hypothetical protein K6T63_08360 [Alicyclobacillus herbarius]|uniref:hypothetical protein n=1 Tax=Alicyclobacillus herbarius TaxID=122960 RepID=UPI002353952A|nr:hypothetical protein [Alicyclobacillus herbarius]MCL6632636.1 hypothetical protein [Alicyclobacillus herbarius]